MDDLEQMTRESNPNVTEDRKTRALAALWTAHSVEIGLLGPEPGDLMDPEDADMTAYITDLITDLMHLADALDLEDEMGGQDVSDSALMHYYAERDAS